MKRLLFIMLLFYCSNVSAQEVRDSVKIYFRQGYSRLDSAMQKNRMALNWIADSLRTSYADSVFRLQKVLVVGSASPEGSIALNEQLSQKRAEALFDYLSRYRSLPDSLKVTKFLGRNWNGLIRLVEADAQVPYREETLKLLHEIVWDIEKGITPNGDHLKLIQRLREGIPYRYMFKNLFPELRVSQLQLWYEKVWNPIAPPTEPETSLLPPPVIVVSTHDTVCVESATPHSFLYMAVKTNMLYDAILVPNLGVEFYVGKNWSIAVNWMYARWKCDHRHNYWRTYGGDIEIRRWFGKKAKEKPLTGHHFGLYGQMLTYDFELRGRGYMSSNWNYASGISYGYSHPISRRLNIDFTIGVGYLKGEYKEYIPIDQCYVWQTSKQRRWFGPTKAEVSLVWLIGSDNHNLKKGGRR